MDEYIGKYRIKKLLGKGGMGEVFLAHDPTCHRSVALKRIRPDLFYKKKIRRRFLWEAQMAACLTHPSIISIYSIHPKQFFYTMACVNGDSLKALLRKTSLAPPYSLKNTQNSLIQIFLSTCKAMAYAHSKGIIHRDIKPENIVIGEFGEIILVDWGLAEFYNTQDPPSQPINQPQNIPGTPPYIAPELLLGFAPSIQSDIYSLGVILYQILTFKMPPFSSQKTERHKQKILPLPSETAPDKDIPSQLERITMKCLKEDRAERYQDLSSLICDVERFLQGAPEWIFHVKLDLHQKSDWCFHENVAITQYFAIIRSIHALEWVNIRISSQTFSENMQITTQVIPGPKNQGVGFLLNASAHPSPKGVDTGYYLWISSVEDFAQLYFEGIFIAQCPATKLLKHQENTITIVNHAEHITFSLNQSLEHSFAKQFHSPCAHFGVLLRDGDIQITKGITIHKSNHNALVNCLAVPDSFFNHKYYTEALQGYQNICTAFPGRLEGREALFRIGFTLLQQAKEDKKIELFDQARKAFEDLRSTPGAPLEYVGKAWAYEAENNLAEEIKCWDLSLRKYHKHPLWYRLEEYLTFRLRKAIHQDRKAAYHFALLVFLHIPHFFLTENNVDLRQGLQESLENLPFFCTSDPAKITIISLAFWTNRPLILLEFLEKKLIQSEYQYDALSALCMLGSEEIIKNSSHYDNLDSYQKQLLQFGKYLQNGILPTQTSIVYPLESNTDKNQEKKKSMLQIIHMWIPLIQKNLPATEALFTTLPQHTCQEQSSPFFFLYGIFLAQKFGKEKAKKHLLNVPSMLFPSSTSLFSYFLKNQISLSGHWGRHALHWERVQLLHQIHLFSLSIGDMKSEQESLQAIQDLHKKCF